MSLAHDTGQAQTPLGRLWASVRGAARARRSRPVERTAPIAPPGRWQRQVTLGVTLLVLLAVLLLATVAAIGGLAYARTSESIEELARRHFGVVSGATAHEVRDLLEPAVPILAEFRQRVGRGLLSVDDLDALGEYLVERLRYQPDLAWLSYSEHATGRFVGAWRHDDGSIVLNQSAPDLDDGRPSEVVVHLDGSRTPLFRDVKPGYDPRQQAWYRQAVAHDGVIWTQPFEFNEGRMGITAALALRERGSDEPRGVFTADFFLEDLSRFLSGLTIGRTGRAFVLSRDQTLVASPSLSGEGRGDPVLDAALRALPQGLATLKMAEPLPLAFDYERTRYVAAFEAFSVSEGLDWVTAIVVPEVEFLGVVYENARFTVYVGLLALIAAVLLGYLLAYRITGPLRVIASDLEQVGQFKLSLAPPPTSFVKEIAVVSDSFERMKASLRSFGRYVPAELVRDLLASGEEARLGGQTRLLTIFSSDIVGFTRISENMPPALLVQNLAEYLDAMTETLKEHDGTIDKFVGDGILALFNAPRDVPNHAARACCAALRAVERLAVLATKWEAEGKPVFRARIGLHMGEVLVGNIGTAERFAYTAIGDAVNLACRLEALNKLYGTAILASEEVREAAGPGLEWRRLDRVAVFGRTGGTLVSELLGEQGRVDPAVLRARDQYEEALAAYFDRRFPEAMAGFRAAAAALPQNRAAEMMARRAETMDSFPPPPDWAGVYLQTVK